VAINLGAAYVDIVPSTQGLAGMLRRQVEGPVAESGTRSGTGFGSRFVDGVASFGGRVVSALSTTIVRGVQAAGLTAAGVLATTLFSGFNRFTALEDAAKMLEQLGLTGDQSSDLMGALNKTLTGTAFSLDEGAGALTRLVSASVPLEDIPGILDSIADAAAFGQTGIGDIGTIFSRIASQGRVTAQELNMLTDRNIPAFELLASALGLTTLELRDLVSSGGLDAETFFAAWAEGAKGFGENNIQMEGAAQSMGDTTRGSLANLRAAMARFGATAFAPLFERIAPAAERLREAFDRLAPVATQFVDGFLRGFDRLSAVFQEGGIGGVFGLLRDQVVEAWPSIRDALETLGRNILDWVVATVPVIARQVVGWGAAFVEWILPRIPPMLQNLGRLLGALGSWLLDDGIPLIASKLVEWGWAFIRWIVPMIPPFLIEMGKLLLRLQWWITSEATPKIVSTLLKWAGAFLEWVVPAGARVLRALGVWLITDMLPWALELPGKIAGWIISTAGDLFRAGTRMGAELARGIRSGLGDMLRIINPALDFGLGGIGPDIRDKKPPGRASGGPVGANRPYIVGERGPELFVPASHGTIVPNSAMGGGAYGGTSITVYADRHTDGTRVAREVDAELRRLRNRNGRAA
jgi:tape measure domain-containing protein